MCLKTSQIVPLIAERDIPVYKVLLYRNNDQSYYRFPELEPIRYFAPYNPAFEYVEGINVANRDYKVSNPVDNDGIVAYGWLHAFLDLKAALNLGKMFQKENKYSRYMVTCMIIPKGSKYYVSCDSVEICSDKLYWKPDYENGQLIEKEEEISWK